MCRSMIRGKWSFNTQGGLPVVTTHQSHSASGAPSQSTRHAPGAFFLILFAFRRGQFLV